MCYRGCHIIVPVIIATHTHHNNNLGCPIQRVWQSPMGNRVMTHWASMLRWIWSISECTLTIRDSPKWTLKSGPYVRERRGSRPKKQQPKHNPCRPLGRNWKEPIFIGGWFYEWNKQTNNGRKCQTHRNSSIFSKKYMQCLSLSWNVSHISKYWTSRSKKSQITSDILLQFNPLRSGFIMRLC